MEDNYLKNVQMLSGLSTGNIRKFNNIETYAIQNEIYLNKVKDNNTKVYAIEVQYGTIYVNVEDKANFKYKFVPSTKFIKSITGAISDDFKPIESTVEENLESKFSELFKGLF